MGLWGKIKKAVKKAADAVKDTVNDAGDAVGNAVEAVGDAISDGLGWAGDKVGGKNVFSWLGGVVKGVFAVAGAVIKGAFGIVGGILGGIIKIVGGILTLQGSLILEGFQDIISPIIGTILVVGAKAIAYIQAVTYLQYYERPLKDKEKKQLQRVFKDSLNYYVIRIVKRHAGIFDLSSKAVTVGNTIYMKRGPVKMTLLVHETTHVWQYQQNGDRYMSDAIAAQLFVPDGYNWVREIEVREKEHWSDFNAEAQAEFLEDLWRDGALTDSDGVTLQSGEGAFFDADWKSKIGLFIVDGTDYTQIAREAVQTVQNEWF